MRPLGVASRCSEWHHPLRGAARPDAQEASEDHRRRDFAFVVIPREAEPRLTSATDSSTLMTAFAHPQLDAMWQPDARRARACRRVVGYDESQFESARVGQPLSLISKQGTRIEGSGTGSVGRRRKR